MSLHLLVVLCLPCVAGWTSAPSDAGLFLRRAVLPVVCYRSGRGGVAAITAQGQVPAGSDDEADSRTAAMEEKLARWRAQAEKLRLQDKDSAVSRALASRLSREESEGSEDAVLSDDNIGGPRGSPRRTVVDRMRELKIAERRAELSRDVEKLREEEELSGEEREARRQEQEAERIRMQREIEVDSLQWAEKKKAYWKDGYDAVKDMPSTDRSLQSRRLAEEYARDKAGIRNRPNEKITAKLQAWKDMSAERKARQLARASVDLASTTLNAVAILIGIILQKPVEVPETSFKGGAIRATVERIRLPFVGRQGRASSTPASSAKVPGWSDLRPVVDELMSTSDAMAMSDVKAEYTQRDDDETDYLQVKLREKWRLKAEAKRNVKAKLTAGDALDQMSMLISEGDYGGVRALLRDTIEDDAVHRVLLGYQPAAGGDAETVGGKEDARRAPLLQAADLGNREIVHALMQAGANARALDPQGRTASQVAEAAGHGDLAKLLITWAARQD